MARLWASVTIVWTISRSLGVGIHPVDEGAVDLQRVDRELPQIAQRGIARAEVVDADLDAQ